MRINLFVLLIQSLPRSFVSILSRIRFILACGFSLVPTNCLSENMLENGLQVRFW
ncbi:hypothetical protein LEP1GSC120_3494 [Leptospira santarosai str. 200702252]|nr:hypothetical protein LEP1GSC130_2722 [Leptospira santarosai str. 200403458]EMO96919.1 hypothetical protein LEP1GSC120_3494 [Leptospira santarosai str. 200702252]